MDAQPQSMVQTNVIAADISPTSLYGAKVYEVVDVLMQKRLG